MAIGTGAAILGGAALGALSSNKAANVQADAANRASDLQYQQWQEQQKLQEPWRKAGEGALNKLIPLSDYTKFGMDQFQSDPGYAFRLSEGQKALDRSAAARGGLISGSALKAASRYGQEMGSQEYQNAFNRYQAERQAQLGPLQSLAGIGQTSVNALGAAGQNYANQAGAAVGAGVVLGVLTGVAVDLMATGAPGIGRGSAEAKRLSHCFMEARTGTPALLK